MLRPRSSSPRGSEPGLVLQLVVASLGRLLLNTGRRFGYPFAPALGRGLGVSLPAVATLLAASQGSGLLSPFFGPLGDRFGYRSLMLAGLLLLSAGFLTAGLVPTFAVVWVGVFLAGLGKSIFDPAIQAYAGARVPFHRRGLAIGLIELPWSGSSLVGIPLAGLLIAAYGWRSPFFVLGVLGLLGALALRAVVPSHAGVVPAGLPGARRSPASLLLRDRAALGALAFGFLISLANDALFVVYGVWLEDAFGLGAASLGATTLVIGLAELGGEGLTALVSDRVGLLRALTAGAVVSALAYSLLPLAPVSLAAALAGLFLVFLAYEFAVVTSFSLVTEVLPAGRATMMSFYVAALGTGRMAGALAGSALWLFGGLTATAAVASAASALALICLRWGFRSWPSPPR